MRVLLRLGFLASVVGLAVVAGAILDSIRAPGGGARIAFAAGPVDIELHGGGGFEVITFGTLCNTSMYPGLLCTDDLLIRNVGDEPFSYTIAAWSDTNSNDSGRLGALDDELAPCFNVNLEPGSADGLDVGNASAVGPYPAGTLEPGESFIWGLEVSVDDDNDCQGQTSVIFGQVIATGFDDADDDNDTDTEPASSPTPSADSEGPGAGPAGNVQSPEGPAAPPRQLPDEPRSPNVPRVPPATGDGALVGKRPAAGLSEVDLSLLAAGIALALGGTLFLAASVYAERKGRRA